MAFNCKFNRNITLGSGSDGCGSTETALGGIQERFYIYNIQDIDGFEYLYDNRADDTLIISTIITGEPYYYVDASSITYNETQDGDIYEHVLTAVVANFQPLTQDILSDAVRGRFLVCFKPYGSDYYRVFGWKEGATMTHTGDLDESNSSYTITFSDTSNYPLMSADKSNFNLADKQYRPIFVPLYDVTYCELDEHGLQTGWCLAQYVVKVNSAGQALDVNNHLCEYSELPQDAYKLEGVADGGYHILGTYTEDAVFDGKPVRVYDIVLCQPESSGSITVDPLLIRLNSTTRLTANASLTSNDVWQMMSETPEYCTMSPTYGSGNSTLTFYHGRYGGDDHIIVQNLNSYEQVEITVQNRIIICMGNESFDNGIMNFHVYARAYGGDNSYHWTVNNQGLTITEAYNTEGDVPELRGLDCVVNEPAVEQERSWTFTFIHDNDEEEVKTCTVTILGQNSEPYWRLTSRFCEEETI